MRWISSLSEKPVHHRPRILVAPTNLTDAKGVHLVLTPSSRLRKGCLRESCIRKNRTCGLSGGRWPLRKRASSDRTARKWRNGYGAKGARKVDDEWGDRRRRHRVSAYALIHPEPLAASATGLKPTIDLLAMLTTPVGVQGHLGGLGWAGVISLHRSGSDRSILSEVNHQPESRMREVRPSGSEGGRPANRFSLSL